MPIVPNAVERAALRLNQAPGLLLDYMGALAFRTVTVALELGVFEALASGSRRPAELARELGTDERGTEALLMALDGLGYVAHFRGRYRNAPQASKWLLRSSPVSMAGPARFFHSAVFELWQGLDESIRGGQSREPLYTALEKWPNLSRDFQSWLEVIAQLASDEIVSKAKLTQHARRLLDVGGGHGLYSIAFCRRYPQLRATIVDLPGALQAARKNVAEAGLEERITLEEGDYLRDRLDSNFDVALVFNVLHGHDPDTNRELVDKLATALNPGGLIVVWEQFSNTIAGPMATAFNGLFALGYHHLIGGRMYRSDDVERWLTVAGFRALRRVGLLRAPGSSLIMATRA